MRVEVKWVISSHHTPLILPSVHPSLSLRSHRVPGNDGRGLRMGRAGGSHWPTADPPHLPLHQQRVCLLLVLRPGLRLLPLLPPGLWCGVSRQMSHTQAQQPRAGNETVTTAAWCQFTWQVEQCRTSPINTLLIYEKEWKSSLAVN